MNFVIAIHRKNHIVSYFADSNDLILINRKPTPLLQLTYNINDATKFDTLLEAKKLLQLRKKYLPANCKIEIEQCITK